jgi:hypothetical protein
MGKGRRGTYGEDNSSNIVVEARCPHRFLVGLGRTGLLREDKSGTDPHSRRTKHERRSERLAVEDTTRGNNLHIITRQRGLLALAELGDGGDEDRGWDIASVATALASLGTDQVDADVKAFLDVLGVADHVHVEDAVFVELLDDVLGGDADGGDKELGAAVNDDLD